MTIRCNPVIVVINNLLRSKIFPYETLSKLLTNIHFTSMKVHRN